MSSIESDSHESSPESQEDVIKVMIIGEPGCGKTTFIEEYYDSHSPDVIFSHNGVMVYSCKFEGPNGKRRASIYEIPGNHDFPQEHRMHHYQQADVLVFMYAIDDPLSLQMLKIKWIEEAKSTINSHRIPVVFIGTKQDLRDDQQVIERLALENQSPVTFEQGSELLHTVHNPTLFECSVNHMDAVETTFNAIFTMLLMNEL